MAVRKAPAGSTRTIVVERKNGDIEVVSDIPGDAKITFGPLFPGVKSDRYGHQQDNGGAALRIYTSGENQLAVFTGVKSFRDVSLTVKRRVVNRSFVAETKYDEKTGKVVSDDHAETTETISWVDANEDVGGNIPF